VTLDREGMALVHDDDSEELFATEPREVYDVTGAGDMALATLGMCIASDLPLADAIRIANVAAGIEVQRLGVAPVTRAELRAALKDAPTQPTPPASAVGCRPPIATTDNCPLPTDKSEFARKLATLPELSELAAEYRLAKKTTVFTNGCFDMLHVGHVRCLQE